MSEEGMTPEARQEEQTASDRKRRQAQERFSGGLVPLLFKVLLLGGFNALGIFALIALAGMGSWVAFAIVALGMIIIDAIYIPANRFLPGKYLAPGLAFMAVFQVFVMLFAVYIAFTNYGDAHMGSKTDAIAAIQVQNQDRIEGSPAYPVTILDKGGKLGMALVDPDTKKAKVGDSKTPLAEAKDATIEGDKVTAVPGWTVLSFGDLLSRQQDLNQLSVPWSDNGKDGFLKTQDGSNAFRYVGKYAYDKGSDTMTEVKTGKVYSPSRFGEFTAPDGEKLAPGWQVGVGFENFKSAVSNPDIREPFVKVTIWTFAFALLSVLLCFVVGLFFAIVLNDPRVRFRRLYRSLLIFPYAVPAFVSALVWSGLLNTKFGFINQVLLGGASIDWLGSALWAKVSLLLVNAWLGYPYMFIVCTGALQSIPDEALEAAKIDGASGWQVFRHVKLPLLMVPIAPLLISSFAFNFNNFSLIWMLTGGGPRFSAYNDIGQSDILISMVYKIANSSHPQYGLASAFSILIFLVVGAISWFGFKQTKSLEDIN